MIDAAILIPVYRADDGGLRIVMILRKPGGVHGGQLAFPGGKHEPEDETMLDTALREAREELGLAVPKENVLAELPMAQTRTTGYRVFPYLARIAVPAQWQIAEREIAELVDAKLSDLAAPGAHDTMIERFPTWQKAEQVSYYQIGPHRLWGLSYRILHPVIPRLVAGEWGV
ncbi:MAG TPA: CoA pyrophosphatase [Candidatus Limnocylindria bacterium]|nr:CoA pyrophosphatase [Candidatus Limnocylindria bacterium]